MIKYSESAADKKRHEEYERLHRSPEVRAQLIRALETMLEQYPMLRLGQLLTNAVGTAERMFNIEDDQLLREVEQLRITYQQFQAAGIKKGQL